MKFNKIFVIGLGCIGLPTANHFAANETKTAGGDIFSEAVKKSKKDRLHIDEPGLQKLLQDSLQIVELLVNNTFIEEDVLNYHCPTFFLIKEQMYVLIR